MESGMTAIIPDAFVPGQFSTLALYKQRVTLVCRYQNACRQSIENKSIS